MTNETEVTKVDILKTIKVDCKAIVHRSDNLTWVCKMDRKYLVLIGENYETLREFELNLRCDDFALTKFDEIIATDFKNKRVMKVRVSGDVTMETVILVCSTYPWQPCGICVNDKQEIIVGVGIEPAKLLIFTSDGKTLLQEINKDENGEHLFKSFITQIKQNYNGDYVVADDTRLVCLDKNWCVKWEWNMEHTCVICGVCCDTDNNIIVGDRGKCEIVVLNGEGQRSRVLRTDARLRIYNQMALSMDTKGRLWIGQSLDLTIVKIN